MRIFSDSSLSSLETALKDLLSDQDILAETIEAIYAETGAYSDDVFMEADIFFDSLSRTELKDILLDFYNGEDLDSRGPANPNRDYFRFDAYHHVESTDDPKQIYEDDLLDEICDYILDDPEADYYPDEVLDLIADLLDFEEKT